MGDKSRIAWTDATWNPISGCSRVSEGCRYCYAARADKRIRGARGEEWRDWSAENAAYNVRLHPERLDQPLRWRKSRRIFVNSMSDLFHEQVPDEFINAIFKIMVQTPRHTFQILTKRAKRLAEWGAILHKSCWDVSNLWIGVSVENSRAADERIPLLLQVPAAVHFVSCEPLLEQVQLNEYWREHESGDGCWETWLDGLDWVIVGGESGPHYREMNLDWARALRDQCVAADVPYFFKQEAAARAGKNSALDGVVWHQFPNADGRAQDNRVSQSV